ncbi:MAG: rod shape-determining protein RodA [Bacteroidetes bacterium]|nr:rod shape-determining protein RodA [Bacteroidota bacterium]
MRVWYKNFDWFLVLSWMALVGIGLVAIYSTTHGPKQEFLLESVRRNFDRQAIWMLIAMAGSGMVLLLPVRFFQNMAYPIYVLCLILLVVALAIGREINGARSWIHIGGFGLQVSEIAKVGTVLAVAQLLSSRRAQQNTVRYASLAVLIILVPAVLIVLQHDTGTALVFFALIPIMLFWSGFPFSTIALMISPAIAGYMALIYYPVAIVFSVAFAIGLYAYSRERYVGIAAFLFTIGTVAITRFALPAVFNSYQLARILSFTNPEAEEYRYTTGFHLVQSKAAIGSGGLTGKGFMLGTQTQGDYIPEQSTDFVFSVIGEEWGFIGGAIVLLLFAFLLVRLVYVGVQMKHPFGVMTAAGAAGILLVHLFVNVGMAMAILPVIGIPLPFLSYGGSALLANTLMLAIVINLYMRRDDFSIYGY